MAAETREERTKQTKKDLGKKVRNISTRLDDYKFEWAWQKPKESRRLKHLPEISRKRGETNFDHNFRILTEMLRTGPWNRLPLTIRWITGDFVKEFPVGKTPPLHMSVCHGRVKIIKLKATTQQKTEDQSVVSGTAPTAIELCAICCLPVSSESVVSCLNPKCCYSFHLICLGNHFKHFAGEGAGHYIPVEGDCPECSKHMLWGDVIRKRNGCSDLEKVGSDDDDDEIDEDDDDNGYSQQFNSTIAKQVEDVICLSDSNVDF